MSVELVAGPHQDHGDVSPVFRIIYVSECILPTDDDAFAAAIDRLLRFSRVWNADHEITGTLVFSTGYFAQVLEGPPLEVKALAGSIFCDTRHRNFRLLEAGPVPSRLFGNWSMAYTDGIEQFDLLFVDVLGPPNASQGASISARLRRMVTPDGPVP